MSDFDIDLLPPASGIECRSGGASGDYTMVFRFANALTSVNRAAVKSGVGTIASTAIGTDAHEYIVNLTGVSDGQTITVGLTNLSDSVGNFGTNVSGSMSVLLGDTTANGQVNSSDVSQAKAQSGGTAANATNFRTDVNLMALSTAPTFPTLNPNPARRFLRSNHWRERNSPARSATSLSIFRV